MPQVSSYIVEVAPAKPATETSPATGPEYRAAIAKDGAPGLDGMSTLYEMFMHSVQQYGKNNCLGYRKNENYEWMTYKEVEEMSAAVGSAMANVGVPAHGKCGVYGANSPEWMIAMQACNRMNIYCVPLYDSLGENAIEYIVNHSESCIVFVQSEKMEMLTKALPKVSEIVKTVVYWGKGSEDSVGEIKNLGMNVYSWDEFIAMGKENAVEARPPKADDLCTIMYTSGTTGNPKGVEITHNAVLKTAASQLHFLASDWCYEKLTEEDVYLSFLPLAHIFDRAVEEVMLHIGGSIGYWRGDIKGLTDDIATLRPTIFAGVPRVFDRIYAGVMAKMDESFLKKFLFNWGYHRKLDGINKGVPQDKASPFFDKLLFSKIKARLGGRVRLVVSGGAPLSRHVEDFLKVTMCCEVVQGYGLTETCAASFISVPGDPRLSGTVGPPQPSISFRLESVPEMNYDPMADPPRGEICIRGESVFVGYHKDDEKTKEVLDEDGWFHTGDIGEITPCGGLRIIDRKKNIFKLAQGEYIAVEKIESVYKLNPYIEQVWVYGNSFESCLVAVVVPVQSKAAEFASEGTDKKSLNALCQDRHVVEKLLESMTATARAEKLKGFEIVKAIHLEPEQFSVENDLLTPTFKLKRPQLQKKYQAELDRLYLDLKKK